MNRDTLTDNTNNRWIAIKCHTRDGEIITLCVKPERAPTSAISWGNIPIWWEYCERPDNGKPWRHGSFPIFSAT
jgi:hypothetical protein